MHTKTAELRTDIIITQYAAVARLVAQLETDAQQPLSLWPRARSGMLLQLPSDESVELIPHETHEKRRPSPRTWQPVRPEEATRLTDSRLQLHHAAQFAAAAGISFLPQLPDD